MRPCGHYCYLFHLIVLRSARQIHISNPPCTLHSNTAIQMNMINVDKMIRGIGMQPNSVIITYSVLQLYSQESTDIGYTNTYHTYNNYQKLYDA